LKLNSWEAAASVGGLPVSPGWTLRGALGACLGHEAGDSKGQQRRPADSCALALTSGEGSEQRRSPGHAVYGMQGVRVQIPLAPPGTTHRQGSSSGPLARDCQNLTASDHLIALSVHRFASFVALLPSPVADTRLPLWNAVAMAEYAFVTSVGVESFAWDEQADEWMHRVSDCMGETGDFLVAGRKYDDTTKPFIEVTGVRRSGAPLDTRLVIIPHETGALIGVAGKTEELDEAAAEVWVQAARCATLRLGTPGTEYQWTAVIAPPAIRITGAEPAIDGEANVGGFRLVPSELPLHEMMPPQLPSFSSAGSGISWPIRVEARHTGYNWEAALQKAAFDLHRLCALLSIALSECLVVRETPAPVARGVRRAPSRLWWHQWTEDIDTTTSSERRNVKTMPDWVPAAWQEMNNRPQLGHAVAVHHEGLRAQYEHPSLALIAFVASVEAVANLLFRAERCPECNVTKMWLLGFVQRFDS
jgi:hypothetical protein